MTTNESLTRKPRAHWLRLCGAALGLLISAQTAGAATLGTSVLKHSASLTSFCFVTNVGTKPVSVEVTMYRYDGSPNTHTVQLLPQGTNGVSGDPGAGADRCVFTVAGSAKSIRASVQIWTQSGETYAALPAQ